MNHAIQRAQERYGLTLTVADILQVQRQICLGEAVKIKAAPGHQDWIFAVKCKGLTVVVVATREHGQIKTFLPPEAASKGRRPKVTIGDSGRQARRRG